MKRFLIKIVLLTLAFVVVNMVMLFSVPRDKNHYMRTYSAKIQQLDATPPPRIIFIGGSNIPFGISSPVIADSLHRPVIDLGLQAGIGARYLLKDCLPYVRKGDVVVLQLEYEHFYGTNKGDQEVFLLFLLENNWRNWTQLDAIQWKFVLADIPTQAIANMKRVRRYLRKHTFDTPIQGDKFDYVKSGFNKWGDEVSHLHFPSTYTPSVIPTNKVVDKDFINWMDHILNQYEKAGAKVLMLPPVCVKSQYASSYSEDIGRELHRIGRPYVTSPDALVLDDSLAFNTGYHLNAKGVEKNTQRIISILSQHLP